MTDAERKSVISVLRSLATSRQNTSLTDLVRDYSETEGGMVPFKKFGFRRLEDFLTDSGDFRITQYNTVLVRASEQNAHIQKLVAEQKSAKVPKSKRFMPQRPHWAGGFSGQSVQPNLYSKAVQQLKVRSPAKTANNNYYHQQPRRPASNNNSVVAATQSNKPTYVVTFNNDGEAVMRQSNGTSQPPSSRKSDSSQKSTPLPSPPSAATSKPQPRAITKNSTSGTGAAQPQQHTQLSNQQPQQSKPQDATDARHRLNQKAAAGESTAPPEPQQPTHTNAMVDLRQRMSQRAAASSAGNDNAANSSQRPNNHSNNNNGHVSNGKAKQPDVADLRNRLNVKRDETQARLMKNGGQALTQVADERTKAPHKQQFASGDSAPASTSSLSSRLHNRLKISAPATEPLSIVVPPPNSPPVQSTVVSSSVQSPHSTDAAVRNSLNNRLLRKISPPDAMQSLPQMQIPPPQVPPPTQLNVNAPTFKPEQAPPPSADNITMLAIYCTNKNYQVPSYSILPMPKTNRIQCKLTINGITYSSYPNDFETVREAKLYTAQEALRRLREIDLENQYPVCMDLDSELVMKLYDCLLDSPHGMFERNVPEHFQKTYRQSLPLHWSTLVVMSEHAYLFSVVESVQGAKIVYALSSSDLQQQRKQAETTTQQHCQPTTPRHHQQPLVQRTTVQSSLGALMPGSPAKFPNTTTAASNYDLMQPIVLPWKEKYWNLFITVPRSTVHIWARIIGPEYSDAMDDLIVDIELDMLKERVRPPTPMVGHIYLVVISECTYRVRIDRNDFANERCLCFYIDVGDEEWIAMNEIYVCKPQFLRFPAQAICLSLFGLEDCAENPIAPTHLVDALMNKTLIGEVVSSVDDYEAQRCSVDVAPKVVVALYDTSSDEDVQLNSLILDRICANGTPPQLDFAGITNVIISHVTDDGEVFCQPLSTSGGIHYVQKLIHHITRFGFDPDQHRVAAQSLADAAVAARTVLLVQDDTDRKWYRATVQHRMGDRCRVFYVDYGMTRSVAMAEMYRLDSMCKVLHSYPFQAIVCRLHDVPRLSVGQLATLRGYLRAGTHATVKIMGMKQKVPVVKIFIKQSDGPLFTVNDVILFEQDLESSRDDGGQASPSVVWNSADVLPKHTVSSRPPSANGQQSPVPSLSPLQSHPAALQPLAKYATPAIGERFEVHVTMASNPHNFKVRPYRHLPQFQSLMRELQDYCARTSSFVPDNQIVAGQAYACLQNEEIWYRVVVKNLVSSTMFLISYCDYGDIEVINGNRLKMLPANFRKLPALSMNARLFGVKPINRDWETDDCILFQRMTVGKNFVSRVDNIMAAGSANKDEDVIEMTLIDMSSNSDINVNQQLVLDNRAVPA